MKLLWSIVCTISCLWKTISCQHQPYTWEHGFSDQYKSQNTLGQYAFGYNEDHTSGGSFRRETSDEFGNKVGSYGLRISDGRVRIVNYVADHDGFRANVYSNEPGMTSQQFNNYLGIQKKGIRGIIVPGYRYAAEAPHVTLSKLGSPDGPTHASRHGEEDDTRREYQQQKEMARFKEQSEQNNYGSTERFDAHDTESFKHPSQPDSGLKFTNQDGVTHDSRDSYSGEEYGVRENGFQVPSYDDSHHFGEEYDNEHDHLDEISHHPNAGGDYYDREIGLQAPDAHHPFVHQEYHHADDLSYYPSNIHNMESNIAMQNGTDEITLTEPTVKDIHTTSSDVVTSLSEVSSNHTAPDDKENFTLRGFAEIKVAESKHSDQQKNGTATA